MRETAAQVIADGQHACDAASDGDDCDVHKGMDDLLDEAYL